MLKKTFLKSFLEPPEAFPLKKAVLLAAHGSRHERAREALAVFAGRVRAAFPGMEVSLVHTSSGCGPHSHDRSPEGGPLAAAFGEMLDRGVTHAALLSLHVVPGRGHHGILESVRLADGFQGVSIGGPLLSDMEDVERVAGAVLSSLPEGRAPGEAAALMGHGSQGPGQAFYGLLENALRERDSGVYFATLEGRDDAPEGPGRGVAHVRDALLAAGVKTVWLMPFLTVAGAHAYNDLSGGGERSWKSALERAGLDCRVDLRGLLEREAFTTLWLSHLERAVLRLG